MIIDLDFHDLLKLAANCTVEKDDITIRVSRPILPTINSQATGSDEYVQFRLDSSDPRSKEFAWDALKQK